MYSYCVYFFTFCISILLSWLYQNKHNENFNKYDADNKKSYKSKVEKFIWINLIILVPVIIASIRYGVGKDYFSYIESFERARVFRIETLRVENGTSIENLYYCINRIGDVLFHHGNGALFLSSLITMTFIVLSLEYYKDKISVGFGLFIFYMMLYPPSLNIIRQMIAVSIIFYSYRFILERKLVLYVICVFIAMGFHATAIICLPFYLFSIGSSKISNVKKFIIYCIIIFSFFYIGKILNFASSIHLFNKYFNIYEITYIDKTFSFLIKLPIVLPILINRKEIVKLNYRYEFYIYILLLELFFIGVGAYFQWGFRLIYYTIPAECVLIPALVRIIKNKRIKATVETSFIIWYLIQFIYVFIMCENDGIFPYMTIWNK